jgi:hypothetical protein
MSDHESVQWLELVRCSYRMKGDGAFECTSAATQAQAIEMKQVLTTCTLAAAPQHTIQMIRRNHHGNLSRHNDIAHTGMQAAQ